MYLFVIHNTSLINAYFGLDSRECTYTCLEYLLNYFPIVLLNIYHNITVILGPEDANYI
jgi:hypothetical protein